MLGMDPRQHRNGGVNTSDECAGQQLPRQTFAAPAVRSDASPRKWTPRATASSSGMSVPSSSVQSLASDQELTPSLRALRGTLVIAGSFGRMPGAPPTIRAPFAFPAAPSRRRKAFRQRRRAEPDADRPWIRQLVSTMRDRLSDTIMVQASKASWTQTEPLLIWSILAPPGHSPWE